MRQAVPCKAITCPPVSKFPANMCCPQLHTSARHVTLSQITSAHVLPSSFKSYFNRILPSMSRSSNWSPSSTFPHQNPTLIASPKQHSTKKARFKARFTRQSFPRASSQWHRICGWENPRVLTSYTLVSVLVATTYVHVVTANPSGSISLDV
jgi:hypothetical protein